MKGMRRGRSGHALTSRPESTSKRPDRPKASSGPCNHVGSADLAPVGVRSRALVNRVIQAPWEEVSTGGVGNCSRSSARWSATCREATVRSSGEPSPDASRIRSQSNPLIRVRRLAPGSMGGMGMGRASPVTHPRTIASRDSPETVEAQCITLANHHCVDSLARWASECDRPYLGRSSARARTHRSLAPKPPLRWRPRAVVRNNSRSGSHDHDRLG